MKRSEYNQPFSTGWCPKRHLRCKPLAILFQTQWICVQINTVHLLLAIPIMLTPISALKYRKMIFNINKFKNIQNLDIEDSESCTARNNFCLNWTFYICNETWFCIISCTAKPVFLSVNNYFELLEGKWSITFAWFPPYYRIESTIKRGKKISTQNCLPWKQRNDLVPLLPHLPKSCWPNYKFSNSIICNPNGKGTG